MAVSTTEEEDPRNSGHVWVRPGEPRDVLIVVLVQNKFSYIVVDDETAAKDGVSDLNVMEQNYATGVYEETAFKYAITISSVSYTHLMKKMKLESYRLQIGL